jgi:hypothetical protein
LSRGAVSLRLALPSLTSILTGTSWFPASLREIS